MVPATSLRTHKLSGNVTTICTHRLNDHVYYVLFITRNIALMNFATKNSV